MMVIEDGKEPEMSKIADFNYVKKCMEHNIFIKN